MVLFCGHPRGVYLAGMTSDWVLNRELELNHRMLQAAQDPAVPMLERVKLLATFSKRRDQSAGPSTNEMGPVMSQPKGGT